MFATLCGSIGVFTFLEFLKSAVFMLGYIFNSRRREKLFRTNEEWR